MRYQLLLKKFSCVEMALYFYNLSSFSKCTIISTNSDLLHNFSYSNCIPAYGYILFISTPICHVCFTFWNCFNHSSSHIQFLDSLVFEGMKEACWRLWNHSVVTNTEANMNFPVSSSACRNWDKKKPWHSSCWSNSFLSEKNLFFNDKNLTH